MKRSYILIALAGLLGLADPSIRGQELSGDMRALQGKWRVTFADDRSIVLEFKNETFTQTIHGQAEPSQSAKGSFTIDITQNPKHMTWKDVEFPGGKIEINRCIYELHGDTLLLMGGLNDRPKIFISGPGTPHTTWILKREK